MEMMRLGMSEQHVPSSPLSPKHLFFSTMLCSCSSWLTGDPCQPIASCTVIFPLNLLLSSFKGGRGVDSTVFYSNLYSAYPTISQTHMCCIILHWSYNMMYMVMHSSYRRNKWNPRSYFFSIFMQFLQKAWHIFRSWQEFKTQWIWAMPGHLCNMKRLSNMINKLSKFQSLNSTACRNVQVSNSVNRTCWIWLNLRKGEKETDK